MVTKLNLKEFKDFGYLQEANRQFFHPLGLALTIYADPVRNELVELFIQDWRDDPEGGAFNTLADDDSKKKAQRVRDERHKFERVRMKEFGWDIQPIGHSFEEE